MKGDRCVENFRSTDFEHSLIFYQIVGFPSSFKLGFCIQFPVAFRVSLLRSDIYIFLEKPVFGETDIFSMNESRGIFHIKDFKFYWYRYQFWKKTPLYY